MPGGWSLRTHGSLATCEEERLRERAEDEHSRKTQINENEGGEGSCQDTIHAPLNRDLDPLRVCDGESAATGPSATDERNTEQEFVKAGILASGLGGQLSEETTIKPMVEIRHDQAPDPRLGPSTFMISRGDGVSTGELHDLLAFRKRYVKNSMLTAVHPPPRHERTEIDGHQIIDMTEKPQAAKGGFNGAFFVMEAEIVDCIDDDDTIRDTMMREWLWETGGARWKVMS